ncbi:recombinase family protein [Saccharothrix sp. NEAU-S10]|nr:recombinase family protein [Saccharothrix luteola]
MPVRRERRRVAGPRHPRHRHRPPAAALRDFNEQSVPSPSSADAERDRRRIDAGWSLRTVMEILGNPRYTGRQVWNRTSADRATLSPSGRRASVRNEQHAWAISTGIAHTPLVSEQDFVTAQTIQATRDSTRQADTDGGEHVYLLAGRLQCGLCGRKMDSHRSHGRAAYRCRHGHTSARTRPEGAPGNLYLREDYLLGRIAAHLTAVGIADNPGPEQTARLVDELGLVFRCDTVGVALLDRGTTGRARTPRRRLAPQPVHGGTGSGDRGKAGEQLLLTLSRATASEADQPDVLAGQVDAPADRARPARRPLRRLLPSAAPHDRHRQTGLHVTLRSTRSRYASRAGGVACPPRDEHGGDRRRQVVGRAGRRPLLLPSHRQTRYEQRPSGRVEAGSGNTKPHETSS